MMRLLFVAFLASLTAAAQAQEAARYRLELALGWSAATHPHEFPPGAHFSDLIGAAHDARYVLFADGRTASSGLESLAENGRSAVLRAELAEAERRGRVGAVFQGEGTYQLPGTIATNFEATARHRLVSFATMIAPSPDWFTGAAAVDLMPEGKWRDRLTLTLWAWDAGTGSGTSYTDPGPDTQPRESIRLLATPHFLDATGLKPIGTATLTRME